MPYHRPEADKFIRILVREQDPTLVNQLLSVFAVERFRHGAASQYTGYLKEGPRRHTHQNPCSWSNLLLAHGGGGEGLAV